MCHALERNLCLWNNFESTSKVGSLLDINLTMGVLVTDVLDTWGMLLSRKWAATLGGCIQMDWSYATILALENSLVRLHSERVKMFHVEDPKEPMNALLYIDKGLVTCVSIQIP